MWYHITIMRNGGKLRMFCKNCGAAIEEGQTSCPVCGTAVPSESERSVSAQYAYPPATALPMKWYKFLINFMLFFSAALNAIDGVQFIIGDQYYKDGPIDVAKAIYSQFGALKTVDVVAGIVLIAFALFTLYTRSRLAGYCKNGPKMLLLLYILGFAYTVLYAAAVDITLASYGVSLNIVDFLLTDGVTVLTTAVVDGVMFVINLEYFRNRKHLFVF